MAETYTIESADDSAPVDPRLLRELRDMLRTEEDLDIGVRKGFLDVSLDRAGLHTHGITLN